MKAYLVAFAAFTFGLLLGTAYAGVQQSRADRAEARALEAESRVGAACEPVYMAAWPDIVCEAGWKGWRPGAECGLQTVVYRHTDLEAVRARARKVGPRAAMTIYEERGVKERRLELGWNPEVAP